ncbi:MULTISPECIES: Gfo/Idh/MocA family protein [unclassified Microbacterium]|uniref:Gfo/Idh/MocA family protein n=1 Tax=unclassified Microbacterium TaxID=2609290 RepID=UPI0012FC3EF4|nr:Gfo/Idh/MocA family oxidoreductase [Microbacterium sp. MAH-37]MVQ43741.1 gfo/Idh/MocA family oxidoreductase [Microbacterium sp. MAH-37]
MSSFRTLPGDRPLRIVQVGAGGMGRAWIGTIGDNPDVSLVGLVDLDLDVARAALAEAGLEGIEIGRSAAEVARVTGADAVVNVTVPEAHLVVNREALNAGLPVLCEKPAAPTVADASSQAVLAESAGELLMISQSRRFLPGLRALRREVAELGAIGTVTTDFFKAPRFGGFRERMPHVLLVDMAIHAFDAARYVADAEPVSVYCEEYNPEWSWFDGAANAVAVFEFTGGIRYVYDGSWCAPGMETSWNGAWRVSAALGSAEWDGEGAPLVHRPDAGEPVSAAVTESPRELAGSLAAFVSALRSGSAPENAASDNIRSLAMVEAAVLSAESGQRVLIQDVIDAAQR